MKWISVNDRLPEEATYEIFTWDGEMFDATAGYRKKDGFLSLDYEVGTYYKYGLVTHWMPWPAPPSASSDLPTASPGSSQYPA